MTETRFYVVSDISGWVLAHKPHSKHDTSPPSVGRSGELRKIKKNI
jgi:hypothetical protein